MKLRTRLLASVAAVATGLVLFAGCDSGGGGGSGGNSTIQGKLVRFSGSGATVTRMARAAVGGVTVQIEGTDLVATTAPDGSFIFSGVPAGQHVLIFRSGTVEARYTLDVPDNATIKLEGVTVNEDSVTIHNIEVEVEDPEGDQHGTNDVNHVDDHDGADSGSDHNGGSNDSGGDSGDN